MKEVKGLLVSAEALQETTKKCMHACMHAFLHACMHAFDHDEDKGFKILYSEIHACMHALLMLKKKALKYYINLKYLRCSRSKHK